MVIIYFILSLFAIKQETRYVIENSTIEFYSYALLEDIQAINTVITEEGDKIKINTEFKIALKEHKIKIPRLLFQNIAEEIEVKVNSTFTKFQEQ